MRSVIYGTTAVVHDGFDIDRIAASLEGDGVTVVSLVATQLVRLLEAGVDLLPLRAVLVGGGPVPEEVLAEAIGRGATVVQTYGLTEAASQVTTLAPAEAQRKLGSAGRPLLTTHLRIQDGEILVQGPTVAPGAADEDGWLHTGDLGRIDDDGFLYVTDRLGDVIVTGGENVLPAEVEEVLLRHPDVADAAAVGRADAEWQEAVTAVVVLRDGAEVGAEELRATAPPSSPASRSRSASSSSPSCRGPRPGSCCGGSCDDRPRRVSTRWLDAYVAAWKSYDRDGDRARCSPRTSRYRYHPYDEPIRGRERDRRAWLGSRGPGGVGPDDEGTYDAAYEPVAVDGDVAVAVGTSTYTDEPDGSVRGLRQLLR